jgi:hypothetical protein
MEHKRYNESGRIIVPFVGAGASHVAGIPTASELALDLVKSLNDFPHMRELLEAEKETLFPKKASLRLGELTLFELAVLFSHSTKTKRHLEDFVQRALAKKRKIPLVYELLAHLAKHGFISHVVSMNFDELLDDSLFDELGERLKKITRGDDLPGDTGLSSEYLRQFFLVKPFGTISDKNFRLTPNDLTFRGPQWEFIQKRVFAGNNVVTIILIGYQAAEEAFGDLIDRLHDRSIEVFVVDPSPGVLSTLRQHKPKLITLEADGAFSILVQILQRLISSRNGLAPNAIQWVPTARHEIVSEVHEFTTPGAKVADWDGNGESETDRSKRFMLELLLQAIRSRGFLTLEAMSQIPRITHYGKGLNRQPIEKLLELELFEPLTQSDPGGQKIQTSNEDFLLRPQKPNEIASALLKIYKKNFDISRTVPCWLIEGDCGEAVHTEVPILKYLEQRIQDIQAAPEIEIASEAGVSTPWLFKCPVIIESLDDLFSKTKAMLQSLLERQNTNCQIWGIWTTGEWLFGNGWAQTPYGHSLILAFQRGEVTGNFVTSEAPATYTLRASKAAKTRQLFESSNIKNSVRSGQLYWTRLNRIMTMVEYTEPNGAKVTHGIYMRRRHSAPIVQPVLVSGDDCQVLKELFDRYYNNAVKPN